MDDVCVSRCLAIEASIADRFRPITKKQHPNRFTALPRDKGAKTTRSFRRHRSFLARGFAIEAAG